MDVKDLNPLYDEDSINHESFSFCVGYDGYIDLSQFGEDEVVFSEAFNTYCLIYYCGKSVECNSCAILSKTKNGKN